ncbi:MAG: imidazole glycerol phosphate synthase subunit HisH [Acidimicrobiales bacterium]|nr:imidazole glycerol phosphate synthase subunit HisH [Acidimicrobiales bacterium]
MTRIAVLDYGIGNLRSAQKALEHVGADARLTDDPALVAEADGVVLPGVGNFGRCVEALRSRGLDEVAIDAIDSGRPFLGICVGMQMLYAGSDESPGVAGLGVFERRVRLLPEGVRRPQMQWNVLERTDNAAAEAMFASLDDPAWMYFVHSYAAEPGDEVVATCGYGGDVVAAVARANVWATQFHPEKSGATGLAMLANWVRTVGAHR